MSAILIWGFGILLSLFIVFGKSHNEQEDSSESSRGFTDFAKFALVLSMYVISVQIIMAIVKIAMGFPINVSKGTSIEGMIFNALILIAEIFTLKKNKAGLVALIVLFIARMLLLVPMGAGSYSYFLGGNIVHFIRDFGLFAIAMCFKKNGISGWKSIFASEKSSETIVEESHKEVEILPVDEDKQGIVVEENENLIVEENTEDCIPEGDTQIEKENLQEYLPNEDASSECVQSYKPIVEKRKPTKLWLWGTMAIVLLVGVVSMCIYVNSQEYPKYIMRLGEKFKYCLSIPNNRLAKKCVKNSRKAIDEGFIELSKEYIATARKVKPNKPTIMYDIAKVYSSLAYNTDDDSYYVESKKLIDELLKNSPNDIKALRLLAFTHNNLGNVEESYKIAEQILFNDPEDEVGLYFICYKFYNKNDWDNLLKWGQRGYNLEDKVNRFEFATVGCAYFYAKALYETDSKFDAMRIYAEAENRDPFHWLHGELEGLGGIPCIISSLSIQNINKDGIVITQFGDVLYEKDILRLVPTVKVKSERDGHFNLDIKIYKNGEVFKKQASGYSYTCGVDIMKSQKEQTIKINGWEDRYIPWNKGYYRFEIWWEGNKLYSQSFKIY